MTRRIAALALSILLAASVVGCAGSRTPGAVDATGSQEATIAPPAERAGTVIFDMAHGEVFGPEDTTELGQSTVVAAIEQAGYAVEVNREKFTAERLADVAAVYVPGPMVPFTDAEKQVLDDYVVNGGTIILTIHVPFPIMATPARWGLPVGSAVMMTTAPAYQDPGIFVATDVADHQLTADVEGVLVVSGWALDTDATKLADAEVVVSAGPEVVVDGDKDNVFGASDPQPPYGIVGVAPVGSGRVIVMGDDAIFANIAINEADNLQLLNNILAVIKAPKGA